MGLSLIISFAERTTAYVGLLFICDTRAALKSSDIGPSVVHSGLIWFITVVELCVKYIKFLS